jgi:2-keto-4-pentenoate hydratase
MPSMCEAGVLIKARTICMTFDPDRFAATLLEMRAARIPIGAHPDRPATEAEGVAAQLALARRLSADPPAGFKIGATGRRMQQYLGVSEPVAGFMEGRNLHRPGASLDLAGFTKPAVECELAVRLARDLPAAPCTAAQAEAAVADLLAGIEIVENRYQDDLTSVGTPTLIADQMYHAAAVIGVPAASWRGLDMPNLTGRFLIDGIERDRGVAGELLGHPMNCLAWLAGSQVARAFGGLRAGQVILLGSVTPPVWLAASARVEVVFDGLTPVALTLC